MAEMNIRIEGMTPVSGNIPTTISQTGTNNRVQTLPATPAVAISLNGASGVNIGSVYNAGQLTKGAAVQMTSSATLTAGTIVIRGSLDGVSYADLVTITAATDFPSATTKLYSIPVQAAFLRTDITVGLTGGTISTRILGN